MEKILRNKKIIGMILVALLVLTTKVSAVNSDSYKTTISTANTQVKRGDTVTIIIGLKDIAIESGEKGIGAYTANVKFDSSVLEYSKTDSSDSWEAPFYQEGKITGNTKNGEVVKNNGSMGTIIFKVKENAKLGETTISLNNFSGSTVGADVPAQDVSVKITVVDKNNNNGNNSGNNNSNNGNNNSNNGSNNNNSNSNKGDNTAADGKLPQTGETNVGVYIIIGACALIATISFVKIAKLRA